jgi:hypothetical protein
VALLRQERRGDGGVDAAGHGYDYSHGIKKAVSFLRSAFSRVLPDYPRGSNSQSARSES